MIHYLWRARRSLLPFLACLVTTLSLVNGSIAATLTARSTNTTLPNGYSNHGDPNLLCTPTQWSDVAFFFLGNYAAHAGTVVSTPGEPTLDFVAAMVFALLFPCSGALRGFYSICNVSLTRNPLQTARKAGALCMVIRTLNWSPKSGDLLHTLSFVSDDMIEKAKTAPSLSWKKMGNWLKELGNPVKDLNSLKSCTNPTNPVRLSVQSPPWMFGSSFLIGRRIHGNVQLPDGYTLAMVPKDAQVESSMERTADSGGHDMNRFDMEPIAESYSLPKALIAVAQAVYASVTLYRSRGDQITRYGYAAFGLTVVPYIVMSVINFVSTLVTPEYSALYLIRSEIMDEAEKHGGVFDGVVGRLINEEVTIERTFVFSGSFKECEKDHDKQTGGDNSDPRKRFQLDITSEQIDKTAFEDESKNTEPSDEKGLEQKGNLASEISPSTPAAPAMTQQGGSVIWAFTTTVPTNMALASDPTCEEPSIVVPACYNFKRKNTKWSKLDSRYPVTVRPGVRRSMWHNIASAPNMAGWAVTITLGAIFIAIIGGISHFRSGSSTRAQRAWIMTWINYGIYAGGLWRPSVYGLTETWRQLLRGRRARESLDYKFFFGFAVAHMSLIVACVYSIPAIGGFVVVAKMLREYGDCQRI